MNVQELELYTDGMLAERERITDMLEDLLTELQLESEQALKNKEWNLVQELLFKLKTVEDITKLVSAKFDNVQ
jgi:hypothetical protein